LRGEGRPLDAFRVPLPAPWSVDEQEACFIVRDANAQALAYVYFEEEPGRGAAAKLLTRPGAATTDRKAREEALRIFVSDQCVALGK